MPAQADDLEALRTLCERLAERIVSLEDSADGSVGREEAKARGKEEHSSRPHHVLSVAAFGDTPSNPVNRYEPPSNRRPSWPSSLISFPNDFEEDVNKDSADPAVLACAGTLQRIGRTITFLKYFSLAIAATSLMTVYSLRKGEVVMKHTPGTLAEYYTLLHKYPSARCECRQSAVVQSTYANGTVTQLPVCEWAKADLAKIDPAQVDEYGAYASGCHRTHKEGECNYVVSACNASRAVIDWILDDFASTLIPSMELMSESKLFEMAHSYLEGNSKLASLAIRTPLSITESWATMNMPLLLDMVGDIATRTKLLSIRADRLDADISPGYNASWHGFVERCVASTNGTTLVGHKGNTYVPSEPCDPIRDFPYFSGNEAIGGTGNCYSRECLWGGAVGDNKKWIRTQQSDGGVFGGYFQFDFDTYRATNKEGTPKFGFGTWLDAASDEYVDERTRFTCRDPTTWADVSQIRISDFRYLVSPLFEGIAVEHWPDPDFLSKVNPNNFWEMALVGCDNFMRAVNDSPFMEGATLEDYNAEVRFQVAGLRALMDKISTDPSIYVAPGEKWANRKQWLWRAGVRASGMEYMMDFYSHMANFSRYPNRLEMLKNNFIDELSVTVDYEAYFRECDVKSCTYFDAVQISSSALLSMLLGVLGGFWSVTSAMGSVAYAGLRARIVEKERAVSMRAKEASWPSGL